MDWNDRLIAIISLVVLFAAAGCGLGTNGDDNRTSGAKAVSCSGDALVSRFVEVRDNEFGPDEVTVPVGEAVEWSAAGTSLHTVTSGAPDTASAGDLFESGDLRRASSFCVKFTETGTFNYHCQYHAASGMTGVVKVEASDGD